MSDKFAEQIAKDVDDIFLQEFSVVATYTSTNPDVLKEIRMQFFNMPLDKLETQYDYGWCNAADVPTLKKQDTLEIDGVVYSVVDFYVDTTGTGVDLFLSEV